MLMFESRDIMLGDVDHIKTLNTIFEQDPDTQRHMMVEVYFHVHCNLVQVNMIIWKLYSHGQIKLVSLLIEID